MLKIRPLELDTLRENVVVLARGCRDLRPERMAGSRKVEVRAGGRTLYATIIIADDGLLAEDEAGLPLPLFRRLGAPAGALVEVAPARPPASLDAVRRKIHGETLSAAELKGVIGDLVTHAYSDMEIAAFLIACAAFMTPEETLWLTEAMVTSGKTLKWPRPFIADKHCIGGVPGNRTSLIVAPIVAAHGLLFPKTSSRAITSPAGTADTMEIFAKVDLSEDTMRAVVDRCGACVVWGGRVDLSPADDVLISVERPLSIDTAEQMVASILSKKKAAGSTHLVLDIPVGPKVKVKGAEQALRLRKLFEYVGERLGLSLQILLTDGSRPIGRGVGPVLEARDVWQVLTGDRAAPQDLKEKAVKLAGRILEFDPTLPGGRGEARARELLDSGAALAKMEAIIEAQGANPSPPKLGTLVHEVLAGADGRVTLQDCERLGQIARLAGAPTDPGAGLDLLKGVGDIVRHGEPLYRIHGVDAADFGFARDAAEADPGVAVVRP